MQYDWPSNGQAQASPASIDHFSGPASLTQVMTELDSPATDEAARRMPPLPLGFSPLDDVLNGGLRAGELLILGGAFGVGKTIFCLQAARNVVVHQRETAAMYVCYEHDRSHLLQRLLCLESAEMGMQESALTLRRLTSLMGKSDAGRSLLQQLRNNPRTAAVMDNLAGYGDRLVLTKASGAVSTLSQIEQWGEQLAALAPRGLLVVDYLQKIPPDHATLYNEVESTTAVVQGLKELAMRTGLRILAIAASDRPGLKSKRMRLADLRGSSALQYEADVGIMLNNKFEIVSREHMVYDLGKAEEMRSWVVFTVEKNRAGPSAVEMEYQLDASHFRLLSTGRYVRERLIDEKVTLA